MKKVIPFIIFLLISCSKDVKSPSKNPNSDLDSIINNNLKTIEVSNRVQKSSDSATQKKVVKIVCCRSRKNIIIDQTAFYRQ